MRFQLFPRDKMLGKGRSPHTTQRYRASLVWLRPLRPPEFSAWPPLSEDGVILPCDEGESTPLGQLSYGETG